MTVNNNWTLIWTLYVFCMTVNNKYVHILVVIAISSTSWCGWWPVVSWFQPNGSNIKMPKRLPLNRWNMNPRPIPKSLFKHVQSQFSGCMLISPGIEKPLTLIKHGKEKHGKKWTSSTNGSCYRDWSMSPWQLLDLPWRTRKVSDFPTETPFNHRFIIRNSAGTGGVGVPAGNFTENRPCIIMYFGDLPIYRVGNGDFSQLRPWTVVNWIRTPITISWY